MQNRYTHNYKKYVKWVNEGRGQGRGVYYKPWLTVRDVPSSGRSHRVHSSIAKRVIHCLSDLEYYTFLACEFLPDTTDIREQFPLNLNSTLNIARELKVKHPAAKGYLAVMTSDFLVNSSNPDCPITAIQVKPSALLKNKRVKQKIEIERIYWQQQGVNFEVVTEKDFTKAKAKNLKWLRSLISYPTPMKELERLYFFWCEQVAHFRGERLIDVAKIIDIELNKPVGTSLFELRQLIAKRYFWFDLNIPIQNLLLSDLSPKELKTKVIN